MSAAWTTRLSTVSRGVRWLLRGSSLLVELGLLATAFSAIASDDDAGISAMVLWDLLAVAYLSLGLLGVWLTSRDSLPAFVSADADQTSQAPSKAPTTLHRFRRHRVVRRLLGLYWGLLPVLFSLLGLTAALNVLFLNTVKSSGDDGTVMKGVGAVAMVSAWLLLHVSYARRYQWFYDRDGGGLEFPGEAHEPTEVDYLYFAMTLGSSFATSDVNVTTTRMRWHVLIHSVLSFFYNAIVLAVGFRILTGG